MEYSPASDDADDTRQSYAAATARPPGHTNNPRTPPAALLTPLRGTRSLRPHTTLRQIDLAGWTPNWDDGATDTNESTNMDPGITGPEAPRRDPAPMVDNATAAAHTAGDTASLDSGSPPLLSPDPTFAATPHIPFEDTPPPLQSEDTLLDGGASVYSVDDDPMAKFNAAISLHLAELNRQRIAIGKKYDAFHDLLVQTRTDFNVSAIKARVSSAVAAQTASIAAMLTQSEEALRRRALTSVDTAMTAAVAPGCIMEQLISDEVKLAVCTAVDNIVDRNVRPHVQDAVDDIFVSYKDCVLTDRSEAEFALTAHWSSAEIRLQQGTETTVHDFHQIIGTTTLANIAKIDDAVRTANAAFKAKRASIVDSIMAAHRVSDNRPTDKPSPQVHFSGDNPAVPPPPPPTELEILAERGTPVGASRAAFADGPQSTASPTPAADPTPCDNAEHGGALHRLPDRSTRPPPVYSYRPDTWNSRTQRGAPADDNYTPSFASGPRARYDNDCVRYGGALAPHNSHPPDSRDHAHSPSSGPRSPHGSDLSNEYHRGQPGIPNDCDMSALFLANIGFQNEYIQYEIMRVFRQIRQGW